MATPASTLQLPLAKPAPKTNSTAAVQFSSPLRDLQFSSLFRFPVQFSSFFFERGVCERCFFLRHMKYHSLRPEVRLRSESNLVSSTLSLLCLHWGWRCKTLWFVSAPFPGSVLFFLYYTTGLYVSSPVHGFFSLATSLILVFLNH